MAFSITVIFRHSLTLKLFDVDMKYECHIIFWNDNYMSSIN